MTIQKGAQWGVPTIAPTVIEISQSDHAITDVLSTQVQCITGGEMWRCLGEPQPVVSGQSCHMVEIDALRCVVTSASGSAQHLAASHVQIGTWFASGRFIVLSNSGVLGIRRIAPRAHPNDGVVDLIEFGSDMSKMQRLLARKKSIHGLHIPHPSVGMSQVDKINLVRSKPREPLYIDGLRIEHWDSLDLTVESNYWQVLL